jgi:CDP-diacylglycerol---glycerol-3-phosphate 3-phosphatidyltransferase
MVLSGQWAVALHLAVAAASVIVFLLAQPKRPARLSAYRGPMAVLGAWACWVTRPVLAAARALRIRPATVSGGGLALSAAAGVLAGLGAFGWAWVALLWGSAADMIDGELARSTGTSSRAGAFLDSNLDRVSEFAVLSGLGFLLHPERAGVVCAVAALAASFMVSYARARGEGLGVACPAFGLERPHRLALLIFSLLAATFLSARAAAQLLTYTCGAVALGAGLTALGRMVVIHQLLRRGGEPSQEWRETPPGAAP